MAFQPDPSVIRWRMHLASPPERVYHLLATPAGRAAFWAESAEEVEGVVSFRFSNGMQEDAAVLEADLPRRYSLRYFGSVVVFDLEPDGAGGTDLALTNTGFPAEDRAELVAGWLNVLFPPRLRPTMEWTCATTTRVEPGIGATPTSSGRRTRPIALRPSQLGSGYAYR